MQFVFFNKIALVVTILILLFICSILEGGVIKKFQLQLPINQSIKRSRSEIHPTRDIRKKTSPAGVTMAKLDDLFSLENTNHSGAYLKYTRHRTKRTLNNNSYDLHLNLLHFTRSSKNNLLPRKNHDIHRKPRDQTIVKYFHTPKKKRGKKKILYKAIPTEYTTFEIEAESTDLETENSNLYTVPEEDSSTLKKKHTKKNYRKTNHKYHTTLEAETEAEDLEDSSMHTVSDVDSLTTLKKQLTKKKHKINHKFSTTLKTETEAIDKKSEVSSMRDIIHSDNLDIRKKDSHKTLNKGNDLENSFTNDLMTELKRKLEFQQSTELTSESEDSLMIKKEQETNFQKPAATTEDIKAVSDDAIVVKKEQEVYEYEEDPLYTEQALKLDDVSFDSAVNQNNEYDRTRVIEKPKLSEMDYNLRIKKNIDSERYGKKANKPIKSKSDLTRRRETDEFITFIKKLEERSSYTGFVTSINGGERSSFDATSDMYYPIESTNSDNNLTDKITKATLKLYNVSELGDDNDYREDNERLNQDDTTNFEFSFSSSTDYSDDTNETDEMRVNHRSMVLTKIFETSSTYRTEKSTNIMATTEDDSDYDTTKIEPDLPSTDYLKKYEDIITEKPNDADYIDDEESITTSHANINVTSDLTALKLFDQKRRNRNILQNRVTPRDIIRSLRNLKKTFRRPKAVPTTGIGMKNRKSGKSTKKHIINKQQKADSKNDLDDFKLKNDTRKSRLKKIRLNLDCFTTVFHFLKSAFTDPRSNAEYLYIFKQDKKGEKYAEIIEKMDDHESFKQSIVKWHAFTLVIIFAVIFCLLLTAIAICLTRKDEIRKNYSQNEREKYYYWRDSTKARNHYATKSFSYTAELKKFIGQYTDTDSDSDNCQLPSSSNTKKINTSAPDISAEDKWSSRYEKVKNKNRKSNWFRRFLDTLCVRKIVQFWKSLRARKGNIEKLKRIGRKICKRNNDDGRDFSSEIIGKESLIGLVKNLPSNKHNGRQTEYPFYSSDETCSDSELLIEKRINLVDLNPKVKNPMECNITENILCSCCQCKCKEAATPKTHITGTHKHRKRDNAVKTEIKKKPGSPTKYSSNSLTNKVQKAIDRTEQNKSSPKPITLSSIELLWKQ